MKNFKLLWLLAAACSLTFASCNKDDDGPDTSTTVTFESAVLPDAGYINNTSYTEQGATFNNVFNTEYQSWYGFAVSRLHDKVTAGYTNMYSVYGDGGAGGSSNFAVCYNSSESADVYFAFGAGVEKKMVSMMVTNATYAALSMLEGDAYAKKFNTADGDWFKMTLTGYNASGVKTGSVEFYLADYRNGKSYICDQWTPVDLSPLGNVNKVEFVFTSTDNGDWGMNTPGYACIDNLKFDLPDVAQ